MALQAMGRGSRPPITAAAAAVADDSDPAQRPLALGGTPCAKRIAAAGLPDDAVVEVLSRLPAKYLCRSKCVSKDWCGLISDRLRCRKLPQTLEGFFYGCSDDFGNESGSEDSDESSNEDSDESSSDDSDEGGSGDTNEAGSDGEANEAGSDGGEANETGSDGGDRGGGGEDDRGECGSKDESLVQHIHGQFINLSGISVPLVDPLFSSLRKQPGIRSLTLLHSCNGLILFMHTPDSDFSSRSYIVYNPATEHWVPVPNSGLVFTWVEGQHEDNDDDEPRACLSTSLVFDPVASSHFQLIELAHIPYISMVYTYSSETGKWGHRKFEREWNLHKTIQSNRGSTIFNQMLHLIVSPYSKGPELIAAINGEGETCRIISWLGNHGFPIFLGQSKGLLHCLSVSGHPDGNSCHMTELSIWTLKDYDAEEWELKHTVSFLELFGKKSCQFSSDYNVVTLHPEYNLIFFIQHWDYKLVSYDMDCKKLHAFCTVGCNYETISPYVPYFSETAVLSKRAT